MNGQSDLPMAGPPASLDAAPYWQAAREGRLVLPRCTSCNVVIWYPREMCPDCWSRDLEWFEASGDGLVYSYTRNRRGVGAYRAAGTYLLAYVELAEGPRVLTNIVGQGTADIRIGSAVRAVLQPADESALLRFRPA